MKLDSPNINVMVKACRKAAKVIIRDFGEVENLQVSLKGPGDYVTASDKKVEKILIEELQKARPNYSILSEEIGQINNEEEFRWIIDPIDGTANFLHGIPHFAISIGLEKNKEIVAGIIYDPIKDEMFLAEKGNGSYLNNYRLRVSNRSKLKNCIVFTGGPRPNATQKDISLEEFREQFETNFFSVVRMIQKVAPIMREQGSGNIVNISSVAGRIGLPASTAYVSSKFDKINSFIPTFIRGDKPVIINIISIINT